MELEKTVQMLSNKDAKQAYQALLELEKRSEDSNEAYAFMDIYIKLMDADNSYERTRGIRLLAVNAKWDVSRKIEPVISQLLSHIEDEKPITSRACIKVLPLIAKVKPHLIDGMIQALESYHTIYNSSMQKLVSQDRKQAIRILRQYKTE